MAPSGSIRQEEKCYKSRPMLMCSLKTNGSITLSRASQFPQHVDVGGGRRFTHLHDSVEEVRARGGERKVICVTKVNNSAMDDFLGRPGIHLVTLPAE